MTGAGAGYEIAGQRFGLTVRLRETRETVRRLAVITDRLAICTSSSITQGGSYQGGSHRRGHYQGGHYQGRPYQGRPYQGRPYQCVPYERGHFSADPTSASYAGTVIPGRPCQDATTAPVGVLLWTNPGYAPAAPGSWARTCRRALDPQADAGRHESLAGLWTSALSCRKTMASGTAGGLSCRSAYPMGRKSTGSGAPARTGTVLIVHIRRHAGTGVDT